MANLLVEPRDASTVLLIRDACDGLEVFMVVRHPNIEFAAGALVFPGGAVDKSDSGQALYDVVSITSRSLPAREFSWRVAAVREVYEESGVLLARERGALSVIGAHRVADITARYRDQLASHTLDIAALAHAENIELACDVLVPFVHWVTPKSRPKRFDTRFYVALTPADQGAVHDGHESVDSLWGNPKAICAEADAGKWHLRFPTRMNLEKLAANTSVERALAAARSAEVVKILAEAEPTPAGNRVRIPVEAGYGITEAVVDAQGKVVSRK